MKIKNKITKALAVLLAGAVSVTAFTACESGKDKEKESNASVKEMIADIFDSVSNANTLSSVFSGKANSASKMEAEIEFGSGVTEALGTEVKPLELSSEVKLKGSKAGADLAVSYDGTSLATLNSVFDKEGEAAYIQVPELSDAYLEVTADYLTSLGEEFMDAYVSSDELKSALSAGSSASSAIGDLSDLKVDEWDDILEDYLDVVIDSLPEATNEEDYKGDISGVEYDYKLKTITLTVDDEKKMVENVFDKLKTDETVKDIVISLLGSALEITEDNYSSMIDDLKSNVLESLSDETSSEEINLIYDGDDIVGIKEDQAVVLVIDKKDAYVISAASEDINVLFKATKDGDKLNFDFTVDTAAQDDMEAMSLALDIDNFEITDKDNGFVNDDFKLTVKSDSETIVVEGSDKTTDNKQNSTAKFTLDDVEYLTISSTSEATNASDITIPNGTVYTLDKISEYQESMNIDEFITNIQTALGDDFIAALTELFGSDDLNEDTDASVSEDDDEDAIYLENYYNDDGSFNYDKLKEDLGEEEYEAFMSQIDLDDFDVDASDIEL